MKEVVKKSPRSFTSIKTGKVEIGGKSFHARSSWEANMAAYLQFQKEQGLIVDWDHEPDTFWFLNIKRGVRSYLPDFKITGLDGSVYYIEVKGYMDAKSKTKLKRMAKYYPEVKIEIYDRKRYTSICKNKGLFKHWGLLDAA